MDRAYVFDLKHQVEKLLRSIRCLPTRSTCFITISDASEEGTHNLVILCSVEGSSDRVEYYSHGLLNILLLSMLLTLPFESFV